ncbi:hypothetical protein GCM10009663_70250 [Kitasatospora arboriphila]|uniref:Hemerythrin-like domain-containing protein n=1 Tax=Kitasatospora arboriphila TaxID=258052 RepID=A0ABP4ENI9_9ACTN
MHAGRSGAVEGTGSSTAAGGPPPVPGPEVPVSSAPAAPRRGPSAVLRRWAVGLGRGRGRPPAEPGDRPPDREAQAAALLAVLDAAVAEQVAADRALAVCGEPGPVAPELAELLSRQAVRYGRLTGWLRALPADGDLAGVRDLAIRLVAYHQWMLHQSANLAFAGHHRPRSEAARERINGLGAPADRLRELRDRLQADVPE